MRQFFEWAITIILLLLIGVVLGLSVSFSVHYIVGLFQIPYLSGFSVSQLYGVFVIWGMIKLIGRVDKENLEDAKKPYVLLNKSVEQTVNRLIGLGVSVASAHILKFVFEVLDIS